MTKLSVKYLCKIIMQELCYEAEIMLAHLSCIYTADN